MAEPLLLHLPPRFYRRIDYLLVVQASMSAMVAVVGIFGAAVLASMHQPEIALGLLTVGLGVSSLAFAGLHSRYLQITDSAERALRGLTERWDELRHDETLLAITTGPSERTLSVADRAKVSLYLASLLAEFSLTIHYIRIGYFTRRRAFAGIYEEMLRSVFKIHCFRAAWLGGANYSTFGSLRQQFGRTIVWVVDELVSELSGHERP